MNYIWYLFFVMLYIWLIQLKLFLRSILVSEDNNESNFSSPQAWSMHFSLCLCDLKIIQDHKTCKIKDTEPDINCSRMDALEVSNSSMFCFFASTNKVSIVDWRIYQQFNVCLHIQLWTVQRNNIYLHIQDKFGAQHSLINDVRSLFFFLDKQQ